MRNKAIRLVVLLLLSFAIFGFTSSNDIQKKEIFAEAEAFYKAKKYTEAFEQFFALANKGHPGAQSYLGIMYHDGLGIDINYKKSAYWYKKSVDQGFLPSMAGLGIMYLYGIGVDKNCEIGIDLTEKASEGGISFASYNLYHAYHTGLCDNKNDNLSSYYLQRGSQSNDEYGKLCKALLSYYGIGQPVNFSSSLSLFSTLSDTYSNAQSMMYLYTMYKNGVGVRADHQKAMSYLLKAVNKNYAPANYRIAVEYFYGDLIEKNFNKALHYAMLSEKQHSGCPYLIGILHEKGLGVPVDIEKAKRWYRQAIDMGNEAAQQRLSALQ